MLDDLTLLLFHVLSYHSLWLLGNWVEEQIPSNWVLEAWIGLKQVVHCHFLDFPVPVGQPGVGPLLELMGLDVSLVLLIRLGPSIHLFITVPRC